jgi:ketosteroid isomerase-like protein
MDDTMEVGKKLVALCKAGKNMDAVNALYAPDVESVEVHAMPQFPQTMKGIDAVRKKNQWWLDNHDIHGGDTLGPWPHGNRFIVLHKIDVTAKTGPMAGKRMQAEEAGLYTVKGGKIVKEFFYYQMG